VSKEEVMKVRTFMCAAMLAVGALQAAATTTELSNVPHVMIVADHSGSMFNNDNIEIQTRALIATLDEYIKKCTEVRLTYLPWGSHPEPTHSFLLNNQESRQAFRDLLETDLSKQNKNRTEHDKAILAALPILQQYAGYQSVIFITDGDGDPITRNLPPGVTLFKVALGEASVHDYLRDQFMPGEGILYHAHSAEDLSLIFSDIFLMMSEGCYS
jgi:hypothetical protein